MSPYREPAPRGFRWADRPAARAVAMVLAIVSMMVSIYVGYRYVELVDCLRHRDTADQVRTKAIAEATDRERAADLALLSGVGDREQLRQETVAARQNTDNVRRAHPAPDVVPCS